MLILLEAIANPGQFMEPERVDGQLVQGMVGAAVFVLTILIILAVPSARDAIWKDRSQQIPTLLILAFVIGVAAAAVVLFAQTFASIGVTEDARTAYSSSVGAWLENDYGIKTTGTEAQSAALGEKFATVLDGEVTVVHIVDVTGGGIALVDADDKMIHVHR